MTNFERFKDEIKEIIDSGECVALVDGKPVACTEAINCRDCDFGKADEHCPWLFTKWLYEEYKEPQINLPKGIKVDTPILVSHDGVIWAMRHFARFMPSGAYVCAWNDGKTSWSANGQNDIIAWQYAKLPEE